MCIRVQETSSKFDNDLYRVSPDLVTTTSERTSGYFCSQCKRPTYSKSTHSSFRDFDPMRISPELKTLSESLTCGERLAISRSIVYIQTTKLSNGSTRRKSHAFTVPVANPEFVSTSGLATMGVSSISVLCVGCGVGLSALRQKAMEIVTIGVHKCRSMLQFFHDVGHPLYQEGIPAVDELQDQARQLQTHIIALDDFAQIRPPKGTSIAFALVNANIRGKQTGSTRVNMPYSDRVTIRGADIFGGFERAELSRQERASSDPHHSAFLKKFSLSSDAPPRPITADDVNSIQRITPELIRSDPAWTRSTFIVMSNIERRAINRPRTVQFARESGRPIFRWILPLKTRRTGSRAIGEEYPFDRTRQLIDRCDCHELEVLFVEGMPAIVDETEGRPLNGVCRNRLGIAHSFQYAGIDETNMILDERGNRLQMSALRPGEVTVIRRPDFVTIDFDGDLFPMKLRSSTQPMDDYLQRVHSSVRGSLLQIGI